ncbi:MAG: alpha/beta fold hydrolase [Gemmatimonadaceae bacterium]
MQRLQRSFVALAASAGATLISHAGAGAQERARVTAPASVLSPCSIGGLDGDVRCGTVRVPEDHRRPAGRQLELFVAVARATGAERAPDPFLLLSGGPGQAGSEMGSFASQAFGRVREHRDLVLLDVRGTGRSHRLACQLMRRNTDLVGWTLYPLDALRACRDSLSRSADLARYTTAVIAGDLEAVRRAFGWPALNLYGTSYGSRLALAYLRAHPASVRSMVLKAVAPPTMIAPMDYAEDGEAAFKLLERDCRADTACARAFPTLRADLDAVLTRAAAGKLVAVLPGAAGAADTLPLHRDAVAGALLGAMQSSGARSRLPRTLRAAAGGTTDPLVEQAVQYRQQLGQFIAMGMHLSVSCADDGQRLDLAAARATDGRTFLGSSRVRMLAEACAAWAEMPPTPGAHEPVRASTPVLLVSGELDPNTPPRWAEDALRTLPNARHVVLRGVAHGWSNVAGCGAAFVADFVARASVRDLDVACAEVSSAPPFVTAAGPR